MDNIAQKLFKIALSSLVSIMFSLLIKEKLSKKGFLSLSREGGGSEGAYFLLSLFHCLGVIKHILICCLIESQSLSQTLPIYLH